MSDKNNHEAVKERVRAFRFDKGDHVEVEHEASGGLAFRLTERAEALLGHRLRAYGSRACSAAAIEHMNAVLRAVDAVEETMMETIVKTCGNASPTCTVDPFDILFVTNLAAGLVAARTVEGILATGLLAPDDVHAHSSAAMRAGQVVSISMLSHDGLGKLEGLPPGVTVVVEKRQGETTKRDIESILAATRPGQPRFEA